MKLDTILDVVPEVQSSSVLDSFPRTCALSSRMIIIECPVGQSSPPGETRHPVLRNSSLDCALGSRESSSYNHAHKAAFAQPQASFLASKVVANSRG